MFTHKYPDFLIKNWNKKPYSLYEKRRVNYDRQRHMGEKDFYPLELEKKLSKVEQQISKIFKELINNQKENFEIDTEQWFKIIMYCKIQAIRLDNIVHYKVNSPNIPKNNFLFGIFTTDERNKVLKQTENYCDIFLSYEDNMDFWSENDFLVTAMGIVLWETKDNFVAMDRAMFKEADEQGNFLFSFLPISPSLGVVISKNSYFSSEENISKTRMKNCADNVSASVDDKYLINNFSHGGVIHMSFYIGRPSVLPIYYSNGGEFDKVINAMCFDAEKIIFSEEGDEELLKRINQKDLSR